MSYSLRNRILPYNVSLSPHRSRSHKRTHTKSSSSCQVLPITTSHDGVDGNGNKNTDIIGIQQTCPMLRAGGGHGRDGSIISTFNNRWNANSIIEFQSFMDRTRMYPITWL